MVKLDHAVKPRNCCKKGKMSLGKHISPNKSFCDERDRFSDKVEGEGAEGRRAGRGGSYISRSSQEHCM